ncbi:TRAF3-interacting JNK-activating modulator isoform X3 [Osmerus eperlanus]
METLEFRVPERESPMKEYDHMLEERAEKHESLRGRNNQTSCRSPTRGIDTKWMKAEMQRKRQLEFDRRRTVSPDLTCPESGKKSKGQSSIKKGKSTMSQTLQGKVCKISTSNGCPITVSTSERLTNEDASTNEWALFWLDQAESGQERHVAKKPENFLSTPRPIREVPEQTRKVSKKMDQSITIYASPGSKNVPIGLKAGMGESNQTHKMQDACVQTESGFVIVKEKEVIQLADYLQEALWREDTLKNKLGVLQKNASTLIHSSDKLWTIRCNEDLLKSKIKALEAQLQVCLQKYTRDGLKKQVMQMEKQKGAYEEKALAAIQRATHDKAEAFSKTETLQEGLRSAKAEASQWQVRYDELKQISDQLKMSQEVSAGQLQQLQTQLEIAKCREAGFQAEVESLQLAGAELRSCIAYLEEDNQALREEVQIIRDSSTKLQDSEAQVNESSRRSEEENLGWGSAQLAEQLCQTQDKLQLKEKECEELLTELEAVGQECQSYQARLTQCRDELRQLGHHHSKRQSCGSWLGVYVSLVLLLAVAGVAMLWLWHPPFREQVEVLYADLEQRVEDYLVDVASPQHSRCLRPI